jgi:hypothetical protein
VRDISGLYMAPPERALLPCVDEKSLIQALNRTQPLLPMRAGHAYPPRDYNYATHKTKSVADWLAEHPRRQVHFTPTGASWINQVKRFFALLTKRQLRRGVYRSTAQLEANIRTFIDAHNAAPKPFRWTKSVDDILAAFQHFCLRSQQIGGTTEAGTLGQLNWFHTPANWVLDS